MKFKYFFILALFTLPLYACGSNSDGSNSSESSVNSKIYNGYAIDPTIAPTFVGLQIVSGEQVYTCSGTIIGSTTIVTAAHCFHGLNVTQILIHSGGRAINAAQYAYHPGFAQQGIVLLNDVAVVISAEPLNSPVAPLLLSSPISAGVPMDVYGYGKDELGQSGNLKGGVIIPDEITETHIVDIVESGDNTCPGDSGGPVMAHATNPVTGEDMWGLVGITSSGSGGDCTNNELALYTNLQNPEYASFVLQFAPDALVY